MKNHILITISFLIPQLCNAQMNNFVEIKTILSNDTASSIQFYDGLGRPSVSAANGISGDGVFVYGMSEYDSAGNECKKWLPVAGQQNLSLNVPKEISSLSEGTYKEDMHAFSTFEYNGLSQPTAVCRGGDEWHGNGKKSEVRYITNKSGEVILYEARNTELSEGNCWPAGTLAVTIEQDEDGHCVKTYKDMFGNVILEANGDSKTYYVYDERGFLTYVLTPQYQSSHDIDADAYHYRYDAFGHVVYKRFPGCSPILYTYNSYNQIVTEQTPMLAEQGLVRFFYYDTLGRLCIQGVCSNFDNGAHQIAHAFPKNAPDFVYLPTGYAPPTKGYSEDDPKLMFEIINYYDSYEYLSRIPLVQPVSNKLRNDNFVGLPNAIGSLTGQIAATTDGRHVFSSFYYDNRGRLTEECHSTLDGDIYKVVTSYTFTDKPAQITKVYPEPGIDSNGTYTITTTYAYNTHNDQLATTTVQYGTNGNSHIVSSLEYDSLGHVARDFRSDIADTVSYSYDLHGWTEAITSRYFSENLYYADGPITKQPCWNGNISSLTWKGSDGNSHGYYFRYNDRDMLQVAGYRSGADNYADGGSEADRYNEVVSSFTPDGAIQGFRRRGMLNNSSYAYIDNLTYEYDGQQVRNITDVCAPLSYTNAFEYSDSHVGTSTEPDFEYNAAGMLIKDRDKGIRKITYNNIGLVDSILFESGAKVVYTYAMTGEKLRVRHYAAPQSVVSPRAAGVGGALIPTRPGVPTISYDDEVYYGADLMKYSHVAGTAHQLPTYKYFFGNGYVAFNSIAAQPTYYYYTKDHLGNVRSVVKANTDGTAEEVQYTAYYPFGGIIPELTKGTSVQNRLYNGKELDRSNNLWWYDYGARQYIVDAPRFNGPDPLAEKYYPFNCYVYCLNNPVKFIDPDGMKIVLNGTRKQRLEILGHMQRLTNDKLGVNRKTGEVIIMARGTKNRGAKLSNGTSLVSELISNSHTMTIESKKGSFSCGISRQQSAKKNSNAKERGSDVDIKVDFGRNDRFVTKNKKTNKISIDSEIIPHIALGHEMIHGYNAMNGIMEEGKVDYQYTNANGENYNIKNEDLDELMTVGIKAGYKYTENDLRTEQGYDERILYNSSQYR